MTLIVDNDDVLLAMSIHVEMVVTWSCRVVATGGDHALSYRVEGARKHGLCLAGGGGGEGKAGDNNKLM